MNIKFLYISIVFITSVFILFFIISICYNNHILFNKQKFKSKTNIILYKNNFDKKINVSIYNSDNFKVKYQTTTISREIISRNIPTEYDSAMLYMEKIKRDIASRKSILMHKLYLLEQEDKAVRAAFKRMLERLRLEKPKRPGSPVIRDIHSYDKGAFEAL